MADERTDILISGAGLAGMILAALLARRGYAVTICDPAPPPEDVDCKGSDLRSTAYLVPSRDILQKAGLWRHLAPHATPLDALRVMDSAGWPPRQTGMRVFEAADLDLPSFGWNVPNWRARKVLGDALARDPKVDLRLGTGFANMLARDREALVTLDNGTRLRAHLVVGADGRNSPVREMAGIGVRVRRYGQKALAFAATHEVPHRNVSTEIYNSGGAFVTVPLPDHDGRPASSIVWMAEGARAIELSGMAFPAFDEALTLRALSVLGPMARATGLRLWPVVTQTAERLTAKRVALVAEAAHVLPPIGAQGLNTSISDIAALADAITDDPGAPDALARYAVGRGRDVRVRAAAIDAFNRICQTGNPLVAKARVETLKALHDLAPLRRSVMQAGLGGRR